nr:MAG TPA: Transglutaminase family [Caudoviricetes sp.]
MTKQIGTHLNNQKVKAPQTGGLVYRRGQSVDMT